MGALAERLKAKAAAPNTSREWNYEGIPQAQAKPVEAAPEVKSTEVPLRKKIQQAANRLISGPFEMTADMLESVAIAANRIDLGDEYSSKKMKVEDMATYRLAQALRKAPEQIVPSVPEAQNDFLFSQVPAAISSGASFIAGGAATKSAYAFPAISGAMMQGAQGYKDAIQKGADTDTAFTSYLINSGVGVSEILPISRFIERTLGKGVVRTIGKRMLDAGIEAAEETAQELFQQAAGDVVAKNLYDKDRKILENWNEVGGAAGISAALMSLASGAMGARGMRSKLGKNTTGQDNLSSEVVAELSQRLSGKVDDAVARRIAQKLVVGGHLSVGDRNIIKQVDPELHRLITDFEAKSFVEGVIAPEKPVVKGTEFANAAEEVKAAEAQQQPITEVANAEQKTVQGQGAQTVTEQPTVEKGVAATATPAPSPKEELASITKELTDAGDGYDTALDAFAETHKLSRSEAQGKVNEYLAAIGKIGVKGDANEDTANKLKEEFAGVDEVAKISDELHAVRGKHMPRMTQLQMDVVKEKDAFKETLKPYGVTDASFVNTEDKSFIEPVSKTRVAFQGENKGKDGTPSLGEFIIKEGPAKDANVSVKPGENLADAIKRKVEEFNKPKESAPASVRESFKQKMAEIPGYDADHVEAILALTDGRAETWAKATGKPVDAWYDEHIEDLRRPKNNRLPKGAIRQGDPIPYDDWIKSYEEDKYGYTVVTPSKKGNHVYFHGTTLRRAINMFKGGFMGRGKHEYDTFTGPRLNVSRELPEAGSYAVGDAVYGPLSDGVVFEFETPENLPAEMGGQGQGDGLYGRVPINTIKKVHVISKVDQSVVTLTPKEFANHIKQDKTSFSKMLFQGTDKLNITKFETADEWVDHFYKNTFPVIQIGDEEHVGKLGQRHTVFLKELIEKGVDVQKAYNDGTYEEGYQLSDGTYVDKQMVTEAYNNFIETKDALFQSAPVLSPVWYSGLKKIMEEKLPNRVSPFQVRQIAGQFAKKDEVKWTGLDDFLDEKLKDGKPITKQEVLDFIDKNGVKVEEVWKNSKGTKERQIAPWETTLTNEMINGAVDSDGNKLGEGWGWKYNKSTKEHVFKNSEGFEYIYRGHFFTDDGSTTYIVKENTTDGDYRIGYIRENDLDLERDRFPTAIAAQRFAENLVIAHGMSYGGENGSRYSDYQVPGGKEYTELLLTLPIKGDQTKLPKGWLIFKTKDGAWQVAPPNTTQQELTRLKETIGVPTEKEAIKAAWNDYTPEIHGGFQSSHWQESNVLVHVRFNTRTDSKGKKVLFVEEVQSDWHQQGREKGYRGGKTVTELPDGYKFKFHGKYSEEAKADKNKTTGTWNIIHPNGDTSQVYATSIEDAKRQALEFITQEAVPAAPFSQTDDWMRLAMRRVIRHAAESGHDYVAWTPGLWQASRWSQIHNGNEGDDSELTKEGVGTVEAYDKILTSVISKLGKKFGSAVTPIQLKLNNEALQVDRSIITPMKAAKLLRQKRPVQYVYNDEYKDVTSLEQLRELEKFDEGTFLDPSNRSKPTYNLIPSVHLLDEREESKLASSIPYKSRKEASTVMALPITEQMKQSVLTEGQPLFQKDKSAAPSNIQGAVQFGKDGRAIIYAFQKANISTMVHELGHIFRRDLAETNPNDHALIERWAGVKNSKWETEHEEKFARAFEKYLRTGQAPTFKLKKAFAQFKDWLTKIYSKLKGSPLDVKITPEIKQVLDRMLGGETGSSAKPKVPVKT